MKMIFNKDITEYDISKLLRNKFYVYNWSNTLIYA